MLKRILSAVTAIVIAASAGDFISIVPSNTAALTATATENTYGCLKYEKKTNYFTNDEYIEITKCDESAVGEIVIPSEIDGLPVTTIGNSAFSERSAVTSITIPKSVTELSYNAFEHCTALTSITIPDSITEISSYAFRGCTSLSSIKLPNSITKIDYWAFGECENLKSIEIPDSIITIGDNVFSNCTSLTSITIPDSVKTIGRGVFKNCTSLTSITLSNSIKTIDTGLFSGCTALTSIEIPDGVTTIWPRAFAECTALTSITLPDSVTEIITGVFENCTALTTVTLPNKITTIHDNLFYGCTNLTSIEIPDGVTTIRFSAFQGCSSLTSITIPDSVTTIENGAFKECTSLKSITLPDSITNIKFRAFESCESLESITLPKNIEKLGSYMFSGCSKLTSITIPDSVTQMDDNVFNGCSGLTSVTIPESFTKIENGTFSDCSSLTSITLPEGITSIGKKAFSGSGLTSITFPESCEYLIIGDGAFEKTNLKALNINCKSDIGSSAFANCDSLFTAELRNAHVASNAFAGSSLSELIFHGTTVLDAMSIADCPTLENIDFTDCELTTENAFSRCPMLFNIDCAPAFDISTGDFSADKKEFIYEHFSGADDVGFMNQFVAAQLDKVVSENITDDMSDLQKVMAMHDWVCTNTKFTEGNTKDKENHNDASVFINEYSVCEGYARACNLLYNAAGIETYYVQNSSHAWNIVKVGEQYFHVDSTWDDAEPISRDWFLKSDEEMRNEIISHGTWELFKPSSLHSFQADILPECKYKMGDVNFDGIIDASDASDILQAYADLSTNQNTNTDLILADYNLDGIVDSTDASDILAYYAYQSTH